MRSPVTTTLGTRGRGRQGMLGFVAVRNGEAMGEVGLGDVEGEGREEAMVDGGGEGLGKWDAATTTIDKSLGEVGGPNFFPELGVLLLCGRRWRRLRRVDHGWSKEEQ